MPYSQDINLEQKHLFIIGTGPAGPQMATLQALETIKNMDVIIASKEHAELFAEYAGSKPILFDPWKGIFDYKGKNFHQLNMKERIEFKKERERIINERVTKIKSLISEGKNVGLLDNGNPLLFAPCNWYLEQFDPEEVVIIPGMGSDAAALAALGKSVIPAYDTRFVIQTTPIYLLGRGMQDFKMIKDLSNYPSSMILYMALGVTESLFSILAKEYSPETPCAVVYWAGYPDKQKVVKGTIADMQEKLSRETEHYMGVLFIGRFLEGKPYLSAVN